MVYAAALSKICVSLFALVSGYGLYLSYRSRTTTPVKWTVSRYIKTFSGYWVIWILSAIITQLADGRFARIFLKGNVWNSLVEIVLDFLGLANLFQTGTLDGVWWYMSACFVYIMLVPILLCGVKTARVKTPAHLPCGSSDPAAAAFTRSLRQGWKPSISLPLLLCDGNALR